MIKQIQIPSDSYIKKATYTYIEGSNPPKYQVELISDFIDMYEERQEGIISYIASSPWDSSNGQLYTFNNGTNDNICWTLTINPKRKEEVEP